MRTYEIFCQLVFGSRNLPFAECFHEKLVCFEVKLIGLFIAALEGTKVGESICNSTDPVICYQLRHHLCVLHLLLSGVAYT